MPKSIPAGLKPEHVYAALADLDRGIEHPFDPPTGYEILHEGRRYPPKTVVGLAFRHLTGDLLAPGEFSGGESRGQANYVLRDLGFEIVPLAPVPREPSASITSRGFALPKAAAGMEGALWFNMWERRNWPYGEVRAGDVLYWYDPGERALIWKTRVRQAERFQYTSKGDAEQQLVARFGDHDVTSDAYFRKAPDGGYCVAYTVDVLTDVRLPKPDGLKLPMLGWLRSTDAIAQAWIGVEPASESPVTAELLESPPPQDDEDSRRRVLQEVIRRQGQPEFRQALIAAYGGRCAVTGCDAVDALEAAHILPYRGAHTNHPSNGVLLRADVHTLFDLDLIGIHPQTLVVTASPRLAGTHYGGVLGVGLAVPASPSSRPSPHALSLRWERFVGG